MKYVHIGIGQPYQTDAFKKSLTLSLHFIANKFGTKKPVCAALFQIDTDLNLKNVIQDVMDVLEFRKI